MDASTNSLAMSDKIVIDWATSWPRGVDGLWTVEGMTVAEFETFKTDRPGLAHGQIFNALKVAGYRVEWIPAPKR